MEKPGHRMEAWVGLAVAAALAGCAAEGDAIDRLTRDQQSALAAYVGAYHICVARTASQLDDGTTAIVDISTEALDHCAPAARGIDNYLDSIKLPEKDRADYVAELTRSAANHSDIMLRHKRDLESGAGAI